MTYVVEHDVWTLVAQTRVEPFWILTVRLGTGPPRYETMVFCPGGRDCDCWRYLSKRKARAGHARAVEQAQRMAELLS